MPHWASVRPPSVLWQYADGTPKFSQQIRASAQLVPGPPVVVPVVVPPAVVPPAVVPPAVVPPAVVPPAVVPPAVVPLVVPLVVVPVVVPPVVAPVAPLVAETRPHALAQLCRSQSLTPAEQLVHAGAAVLKQSV